MARESSSMNVVARVRVTCLMLLSLAPASCGPTPTASDARPVAAPTPVAPTPPPAPPAPIPPIALAPSTPTAPPAPIPPIAQAPSTPTAPPAPDPPIAQAPPTPTAPSAPLPVAPITPDAPPPAGACAPKLPEGTSLADKLEATRAACGVLLVTREDGLHAVTRGLEPVVRITDKRVRWVQVRREGEARELYWFAADAPDLVRFDLRSGREEVVVRLPRLSHACFNHDTPGPADPVDSIQWAGDLDLDLAAGVLCLDVSDRNVNMMSLQINFRADLRTKKVEKRTVFIGDECREGAGRQREPLCTPRPKDHVSQREIAKIDQSGLFSPSGRWAYYSDDTFQESGDYIYTATFLRDTTTDTSYALTPRRLVKIDYSKRDAAKGPPEGTCFPAGEAAARWFPDRDVLLVEGCADAGWLLVEPPGRVRTIAAEAVAIYG